MTESPEIRIVILETVIEGLKENIAKQAYEYERRLTELNHAHARAAEDKNRFVSSELFYSKLDEALKWQHSADGWRSEVPGKYLSLDTFHRIAEEWNKWRSELDGWRSKIIGIGIGVAATGGLAGGGLAAFISSLMR